MQEYDLYVNVVLENIVKIEKSFSKLKESEFLKDSNLQDATLMRLQVVGENVKKIPSKLKNKEVNWKKFEKLRNLISHRYDTIDYKLVYNFIKVNLNDLQIAVKKIKDEN